MTDIPFWLAEGLAMYFESPDLSGGRGWTTIGQVNRPRLVRFRQYLRKRPADSLSTLLTEDKRFRDPDQALDAYAEAWALTYYLARSRSDEYLEYLKHLAKKDRLIWDKPEQRLAEFKAVFGDDLEKFDQDFRRYVGRVR